MFIMYGGMAHSGTGSSLKALELARSRSSSRARFEDVLRQNNSRLEEAQERAAERRKAFEEQKRRQLEERAEEAEKKVEEMWAARLRVDAARRQREAELELVCQKKAQQAEACLADRHKKIRSFRNNEGVWMVPGYQPGTVNA